MASTAQTFKYGEKKAKQIDLYGDPKIKIESAEHIINFPGGSFSVTRTSNDEYWVHISINKDVVIDDVPYLSKMGNIERIRIDTPDGVKSIDPQDTDHFAILVSTKK